MNRFYRNNKQFSKCVCFVWEHWWFWFNRQYHTCWCIFNSDKWQDWHDRPYLILVYTHFSLFFHILINIHEYANKVIYIYAHRFIVQGLSFTMVPVWLFYLSYWSGYGKYNLYLWIFLKCRVTMETLNLQEAPIRFSMGTLAIPIQ